MNEKVTLKIYGMMCPLCSATIEATLEKQEGITLAKVSYAKEKVVLGYDSNIVSLCEIKNIIEALGFSLEEASISKSTSYRNKSPLFQSIVNWGKNIQKNIHGGIL